MVARWVGFAVLACALGCAAIHPLAPRSDEQRVRGRVTGPEGEIPTWMHVTDGNHVLRVGLDGRFEMGVPRNGARVLRIMSPTYETLVVPVFDRGAPVDLEITLGRPRLLEDLSGSRVVSRRGESFELHWRRGGNYEALIPAHVLTSGVTVVGASEGVPMTLSGASWYEPLPSGRYWSLFGRSAKSSHQVVRLEPAQLRRRFVAPQLEAMDPLDARPYEILRWCDAQRSELMRTVRSLVKEGRKPHEAYRGIETRREMLARELANRVDAATGPERQLWMLSAFDLLGAYESAGQLAEYASAIASSVPPESELWTEFAGSIQHFARESWRCCHSYVHLLTEHPNPLVASEALGAIVALNAHEHRNEDARAAFFELQRRFPFSRAASAAHRFVGDVVVGAPAPPLGVAQLDASLPPVELEALKGRTVLLNFWTTWCPPCVREIPELRALSERYGGRGLSILGVSMDEERDAPVRFVAERQAEMQWIQTFAEGAVRERMVSDYGIRGFPTLILIGPDGRVLATNADFLRDGLRATVERFLGREGIPGTGGPGHQ